MGRGKTRINLIGQKFGRLTVIGPAEDAVQANGRTRVRWLCQCECGTILPVRGEGLRSGNTKSCGCLDMERKRSTLGKTKKHNAFVIHDDYVIMYTSKNEPFLVDIDDFGRVYNHCWYKSANGYLKAKINRKSVFLHRYILDCLDESVDVDHKKGTETIWDNRRCNIRKATTSENMRNCDCRNSSSSGITGVCPIKAHRWRAYIYVHGKQISLGYYDSFEEAVAARHAAEDKYFGEFSFRKSREK